MLTLLAGTSLRKKERERERGQERRGEERRVAAGEPGGALKSSPG